MFARWPIRNLLKKRFWLPVLVEVNWFSFILMFKDIKWLQFYQYDARFYCLIRTILGYRYRKGYCPKARITWSRSLWYLTNSSKFGIFEKRMSINQYYLPRYWRLEWYQSCSWEATGHGWSSQQRGHQHSAIISRSHGG